MLYDNKIQTLWHLKASLGMNSFQHRDKTGAGEKASVCLSLFNIGQSLGRALGLEGGMAFSDSEGTIKALSTSGGPSHNTNLL